MKRDTNDRDTNDSGDSAGAELLEDRTSRLAGGGVGRRVTASVPGALAGTFLVAALAFGAAIGPLTAEQSSAIGTDGKGAEKAMSEPTDNPGDALAYPDKSPAGGTGKPDGSEATPEPTRTPTPTEASQPEAATIDIAVALSGSKVVIDWSACATDEFVAYKIIRSKDEFATWPLGAGDSLAGAITDPAVRRFVDRPVEGGRTYRYRVVALRSWEGGTVAACSTTVATVTTPTPTPKPDTGGDIALTVVIAEGHPLLDWAECVGVDFDYYKVIRSTDATVTWPKGDNDSMVTAIGRDGDTKAWDAEAPGGVAVYYRVFCVRSTESGYVVSAASAVGSIVTPAAEPAPDPVALGFEAGVTGDGVVLSWQAWSSDVFAFYKVVRSTSNVDPSYLPYTDGTEIIGVVEDKATTQLTDTSVASGQAIYYRVQAIGYWNGTKVLLGQTAVIAVTIP